MSHLPYQKTETNLLHFNFCSYLWEFSVVNSQIYSNPTGIYNEKLVVKHS